MKVEIVAELKGLIGKTVWLGERNKEGELDAIPIKISSIRIGADDYLDKRSLIKIYIIPTFDSDPWEVIGAISIDYVWPTKEEAVYFAEESMSQ